MRGIDNQENKGRQADHRAGGRKARHRQAVREQAQKVMRREESLGLSARKRRESRKDLRLRASLHKALHYFEDCIWQALLR